MPHALAPSVGARAPYRRSQPRINLTSKQASIFVWGWQPSARWRYVVAGRRFGKSFLVIEELKRAYRLAVQRNIDPDNELWYGAPTFKQAKRVFWNRLKRYWPQEWIDTRVNNSECVIPTPTGHIVRLVGLDDPDSLRGSGLFFFGGDEWDDAKPTAWSEAIRPMLSTANGNGFFIGSPKGFAALHEGYRAGQPGRFAPGDQHYREDLQGRDPFTMSWKFTSLEGGNIPPEEIEHARATLDPRTFRQEYEAGFETYSGRVYYAFDREHNVRPTIQIDPAREIHIGIDFNVNPMTATCWQERVENGRVISEQFDEIIIPTSNTFEMSQEIVRRYAPIIGEGAVANQIIAYPDPAGAGRRTASYGETDVTILRKYFRVYAMSSHPLVRDRVNQVNSRIMTADGLRHLFISPRCVKSIEAMEKHTYKEGTGEPDKTQGFDHINDATGYYLFTRFAHQRAHSEEIPPFMGT